MKYLLFLNRFELDKEKLKNKLGNVKVSDDNGRLLVEGNLDLEKVKKLPEIKKIAILKQDWKELSFSNIGKEVFDCFSGGFVNGATTFKVEAKFLDKIPVSAISLYKKINSYFKKEGLTFNENSENIIYLEIKKDKKALYRIFTTEKNIWEKDYSFKVNMEKFIVVLENPGSVIEISDFLRICYIFKIPLYFLNTDSGFNFLLEKAKKMTKGIPYEEFKINIVKEIPKDYIKVGFSIKASENEKDLKKIFENKKIALVFGDEKFGLKQETRDKMNYNVRLTPETKKPLRASHALSYVIGIYSGKNI